MSNAAKSDAHQSERLFNFRSDKVFDAFKNADLLSRWWGPSGFTNSFQLFEFKKEGRWVFVMHAPDGKDHLNEIIFREVSTSKIVLEHIVEPIFTLTITITPKGDKTLVHWNQDFVNKAFARNMKDFLNTANEQNFDRLQAVLEEQAVLND